MNTTQLTERNLKEALSMARGVIGYHYGREIRKAMMGGVILSMKSGSAPAMNSGPT